MSQELYLSPKYRDNFKIIKGGVITDMVESYDNDGTIHWGFMIRTSTEILSLWIDSCEEERERQPEVINIVGKL
jgi:hypothetical protein